MPRGRRATPTARPAANPGPTVTPDPGFFETLLLALRWPLTAAWVGVIVVLSLFGLHRYWLVYLFHRHRRDYARPARRFAPDVLPRVTVQLPMFNEGAVAIRVIDAACAIDYPADRLQIQVLDDSNDGTEQLTTQRVAYWRARGVDIEHRHRTDRTGYKAGALAQATPHATGELIAIFDADFVPPADFLRRTVHHFTDESLGMVQTRWEHLNRDDSLLTRGQAVFLDGHFVIEHTARNRSGAWMHFNGTAGLWRKQCIADAGGWHHDTLTEDMDLSYRAQLAGWDFRFLPHVACPAELPPEVNAFKSQQHRWTKGSVQVALKLLPTLLRAKLPGRVKLEAAAHMLCPLVYLAVPVFTLLCYPAVYVNFHVTEPGSWTGLVLGALLLTLGTFSAAAFYVTSQRALRRSGWLALVQVPMLMSIGIGIALNNGLAVLEALLGKQSEFVRTPKYASDSTGTKSKRTQGRVSVIPIPSLKLSVTVAELVMGAVMVEAARLSLSQSSTMVSLPFLILFATGYLYVGGTSLLTHAQAWLDSRPRKRTQPAQAWP